MEQHIERFHPLRTATRTVVEAIAMAPEQTIQQYFYEQWRNQTDQRSADEFSAYSTAATSMVAELHNDDVADAEIILRAGFHGAVLGIMVARTAHPDAVAHTSIGAAYDALSDDIVKNGAQTAQEKSEGMRQYARLHEITLPPDVRSLLGSVNTSMSGKYATVGYIMTMLSMHTSTKAMRRDGDMRELLRTIPEQEFDDLLNLIADGPCNLVEPPHRQLAV